MRLILSIVFILSILSLPGVSRGQCPGGACATVQAAGDEGGQVARRKPVRKLLRGLLPPYHHRGWP